MPDRKRVLITGVAGQIGGVVRDALKDSTTSPASTSAHPRTSRPPSPT